MSFAARIRTLASDAVIYGLAKVAARFLTFALNPFYTHALDTEEYGQVLALYSYVALLLPLYSLGLDTAYLRFAASDEKRDPKRLFSSATLALAASGAALSLALVVLARPLARVAALEGAEPLLVAAAGVLFLDTLATAPLAYLRLKRLPKAYAAVQIAGIVLNVALNLLFCGKLGHGAMGVLAANLASSALTLALLSPIFERLLRPLLDRALLGEMLRFGLPLVPSNLAAMVVNAFDRPLLALLTDPDTVAIYGANHRLGILMMLVVTVFQFAWQPFFLERSRDPDARLLFARVLTYFVTAAMALFLAVTLFVDWLLRLPLPGGRTLFDPRYWEGVVVVPWVLLGYVAFGVYANLTAGPTLVKQTKWFPWIAGVAALLNVGLNLILVPRYGYRAAGWTAFAAYAVMALGMWRVARAVFPIPYEWRRVAQAAGIALALWAAFVLLGGPALGLLARLGLLLAYPLLLLLTGFLGPSERAALSRHRGR